MSWELAPFMEGELEPAAARAVASHLARCPGCREEAADLAGTLMLLLAGALAEPPAGLAARTLAACAARGL
jgi:anti-sigma factor RsiW